MSTGQLGDYVSGKKEPGQKIMERFRAAGVRIDWLLFGEGPMEATPEGEEKPAWYDHPLMNQKYLVIDIDNGKVMSQEEFQKKIAEDQEEERIRAEKKKK